VIAQKATDIQCNVEQILMLQQLSFNYFKYKSNNLFSIHATVV